jgi:hypothetical protein
MMRKSYPDNDAEHSLSESDCSLAMGRDGKVLTFR